MKTALAYQDIEAAFQANRRRVLCVDENSYFLEAVCDFLSTCGHEAVKATTARAALDLIQAEPTRFDALLLADPLHDTDTLELAQALRTAGFQGRLMIKFVTLSAIRREGYQACGIHAFVSVPVDLHKLLSLVQAPAVQASLPPTVERG